MEVRKNLRLWSLKKNLRLWSLKQSSGVTLFPELRSDHIVGQTQVSQGPFKIRIVLEYIKRTQELA